MIDLLRRLSVVSISMLVLFSCADGGSNSSASEPEMETGFFIDGPVSGLKYLTSSGQTGTTGTEGQFLYSAGDSVQFYLGDKPLGQEIAGEKVLTPLNLFSVSDLSASTGATNLVRLLLALDTGDNPYGLTLPANLEENFPDSINLQACLEDDVEFSSKAESLIEALTQTNIDSTDIPSASDAEDHFEKSLELVDLIDNASGEDNLFVSVTLPSGISGSVSISYRVETLPAGITSYVSGHSVYTSSSALNFSEFLYQGDWTLNLFLLSDNSRVQTGDLFTFYNRDGFSGTLPSGYPLVMGSEPLLLQADLTTSSVTVTGVHNVSGKVTVPRFLPDGDDLKDNAADNSFTIFYDIKNDSGEGVASFNIRPALEDSADWSLTTVDGTDYYGIDYSTTLPAGLVLKSQIYLFNGSWGDGVEDYDLVDHYEFPGALDADVTGIDYSVDSWDIVENSATLSLSRSPGEMVELNLKQGDILLDGNRLTPVQ